MYECLDCGAQFEFPDTIIDDFDGEDFEIDVCPDCQSENLDDFVIEGEEDE